MVDGSFVLNPLTIFLAALFVAILLYMWGHALAPPPTPYGHKQEMYTGGEPPKDQEIRPSYAFFHIALFFTVLHVAALLVATATGPAAWLALMYLGVIGLAVFALVRR